ncbi:MAG: VOC family protein [Williamsia sp.]|nr:VOC family protein [Williamsia sp.]
MATKIFVNLPVKDLQRSIKFFEGLGYHFNRQFTDATAACMVISDDIYAMLLTHDKFKQFTTKQITDAKNDIEVMVCLSADNRAGVDELVGKALACGAAEARDPQDYGFMYGRSFEDLDGHIWEIIWMDPSAVK